MITWYMGQGTDLAQLVRSDRSQLEPLLVQSTHGTRSVTILHQTLQLRSIPEVPLRLPNTPFVDATVLRTRLTSR